MAEAADRAGVVQDQAAALADVARVLVADQEVDRVDAARDREVVLEAVLADVALAVRHGIARHRH